MALSPHGGWTASSLLPGLAAGFSAGMTPGSKLAPAQVSGNPNSQKVALAQSTASRKALLDRVMGKQSTLAPAKQPNQNLAANSFSTQGYQFSPVTKL